MVSNMIIREFNAKVEELPNVIGFVEEELKKYEFSSKVIMKLNLVIEEIFVNIASYAYKDSNGKCKIMIDYDKDKQEVKLSIEDNGIKFNPLEHQDPNTSSSIDDRTIGGLGIFLVKNNVDNIIYKYEDNKNILILSKTV